MGTYSLANQVTHKSNLNWPGNRAFCWRAFKVLEVL